MEEAPRIGPHPASRPLLTALWLSALRDAPGRRRVGPPSGAR